MGTTSGGRHRPRHTTGLDSECEGSTLDYKEMLFLPEESIPSVPRKIAQIGDVLLSLRRDRKSLQPESALWRNKFRELFDALDRGFLHGTVPFLVRSLRYRSLLVSRIRRVHGSSLNRNQVVFRRRSSHDIRISPSSFVREPNRKAIITPSQNQCPEHLNPLGC